MLIDVRGIETTVVNGLGKFVGCPVIASNQTAPAPKYPYISHTITTAFVSDAKGFCVADDGRRFKQFNQVWSFTSQSDNDIESLFVALKIKNYFDLAGKTYLNDNGIVVVRTGNVSNRDNIITINYEYRNGIDVTFRLLDIIEKSDAETAGYIENVEFNKENRE